MLFEVFTPRPYRTRLRAWINQVSSTCLFTTLFKTISSSQANCTEIIQTLNEVLSKANCWFLWVKFVHLCVKGNTSFYRCTHGQGICHDSSALYPGEFSEAGINGHLDKSPRGKQLIDALLNSSINTTISKPERSSYVCAYAYVRAFLASPHVRNPRQPGFWILRHAFPIVSTWNLHSGFQSQVGFRIYWVVFWIPKPRILDSSSKISRIPHFSSKNFSDYGIWILLNEAPHLCIKASYYSFKIFPRFWLAKSTLLIHHNQLLMTKFGRILCLTRKWRQKCNILAG